MPQSDTQAAQEEEEPAPPGLELHQGGALLVVDLQRDFLPGGSLAVRGGDTVVETANGWMARFHGQGLPVYASRDWHPREHCSFQSQGGPGPPHQQGAASSSSARARSRSETRTG